MKKNFIKLALTYKIILPLRMPCTEETQLSILQQVITQSPYKHHLFDRIELLNNWV